MNLRGYYKLFLNPSSYVFSTQKLSICLYIWLYILKLGPSSNHLYQPLHGPCLLDVIMMTGQTGNGNRISEMHTPSLSYVVGLDTPIYMGTESSASLTQIHMLGFLEAIAGEHLILAGEDSVAARIGENGIPIPFSNGLTYSPDVNNYIGQVLQFFDQTKGCYFGIHLVNGDLKLIPMQKLAKTLFTKMGLRKEAAIVARTQPQP
jgi:hypothetical protein